MLSEMYMTYRLVDFLIFFYNFFFFCREMSRKINNKNRSCVEIVLKNLSQKYVNNREK